MVEKWLERLWVYPRKGETTIDGKKILTEIFIIPLNLRKHETLAAAFLHDNDCHKLYALVQQQIALLALLKNISIDKFTSPKKKAELLMDFSRQLAHEWE